MPCRTRHITMLSICNEEHHTHSVVSDSRYYSVTLLGLNTWYLLHDYTNIISDLIINCNRRVLSLIIISKSGMCESWIFKFELRNKFLNLDSDVNFSFLNFENFLIAAFVLHIGVMSKGIGTVFVGMEGEFSPFYKLKIFWSLSWIWMIYIKDVFNLF
jgi:hypothetical protein